MQLSRWNDYNFESRQFAFKIVIIFCRHFCYIFKLLIIDITCPESFFLHRNTHFEASKCNSYRLLNEGEKVPWNFLTLTNKLLQFTPYIDLILAALVIRWYFFCTKLPFSTILNGFSPFILKFIICCLKKNVHTSYYKVTMYRCTSFLKGREIKLVLLVKLYYRRCSEGIKLPNDVLLSSYTLWVGFMSRSNLFTWLKNKALYF